MLDTVANILKDKIKVLSYVGRIAGLVRTAVQVVEVDAGEGQNVVLSEKRFPVACSISGVQCWQQGRYQELAPNQNHTSILYFEQLGALQYTQGGKSEASKVVGKIRLVAWFNLARLGITSGCVVPDSVILEIINNLQIDEVLTAYGTNVARAYTNVAGFSRSPDIFSKYSYDKSVIENMLLYPFDYFAIDIDVRLSLAEKCYTPYVPALPVTCIDMS